MEKYLEILQDPKDIEMFSKVGALLEKLQPGHTRIQIENFILNDIEYPTDYGKFKQASTELISRFSRVVDSYFDIKELEIKIKMQNEEIEKSTGFVKELAELQLEKMQIQYKSKQSSLKDLVRETTVFYEMYNKYPELHNLTPEQEFQLEAEQWGKKALNMPLVFEERYGGEVLKQMWGEELYNKFLETRRNQYGILPREIFEVKKLNSSEQQKQIKE